MAVNKDNVKIHVSHLKKNFGSLEVLKDISTDIHEGEVVVIIGPSGSGKSTFLRCMNKLEEITAGEMIVDGHNLTDKHIDINKVRENVGMVFQHFNLFPHMNVTQNLMLAPVELKKMTKEQAKEKGLQLLKRVGMFDKADVYPNMLSGGQKQRVAIARALINEPKILLADEPTGNLDNHNAWEIMKLLEEINSRGTTVVVVTHNLEIVKAMNKRVITMKKGVVVEDSEGDYSDED